MERDFHKAKINKIQKKYDELQSHYKKLLEAKKKLNTPNNIKVKEFSRKINLLYQYKKKKNLYEGFRANYREWII